MLFTAVAHHQGATDHFHLPALRRIFAIAGLGHFGSDQQTERQLEQLNGTEKTYPNLIPFDSF